MTRKSVDIYGGIDPRAIPTYGIYESSHALKIPTATLRSWIHGRKYPTRHGTRTFKPLITLPDPQLPLLSFINLVEAHVLDAIRYKDKLPLENIRYGIDHLREKYGSEHPLVEYEFQHDGVDLFTEIERDVVNVSKKGQIAIREIMTAYLRRIARDPKGSAIALYPFLKRDPQLMEGPKLVLIDPRISFGKPILVGIGVPTSVVADRHEAGESIAELAKDYECEASEIEQAVEYERALPKAA
ncbi:MAG TPA: DUF433 domain-containing protein [Pyrinomonadaceae bacterium]|nr:DUF433 domain-containing protein [Pyrinomonadaceae bacterium]